jgi:hypothetical protein
MRPSGCVSVPSRELIGVAQQLAAADPAGVRQVGACAARQVAVEWGRRCPSRRAAELEAVGRPNVVFRMRAPAVKPEAQVVRPRGDRSSALPGAFLVSWTVASALGMFIGPIAAFFASAPAHALRWLDAPALVFFLVVALCLGTAQALPLSRLIRGAGWWVPATALGWGGGIFLATRLFAYLPPALTAFEVVSRQFAEGAAAGLLAAIPQAFVLRGSVARALLWPAISCVALALAFAVAAAVNELITQATEYDAFCSLFPVWGAVGGLLQGVALRRLLQDTRPPINLAN